MAARPPPRSSAAPAIDDPPRRRGPDGCGVASTDRDGGSPSEYPARAASEVDAARPAG